MARRGRPRGKTGEPAEATQGEAQGKPPAAPDANCGSHAREPHPDRAARVAHIAEMMRNLEWERGKSGPVLAAQWGLDEATLRGDAAEASRIVRAELDTDAVKTDISVALSKALKGATLDGDWKAVAAVANTFATISGAKAPDRHELSGPSGGPIDIDVTQLSDDDLAKLAGPGAAPSAGGTGTTKTGP